MSRMAKKLDAASARFKMHQNAVRAAEEQEKRATLERTLLYYLMRKEGRVRVYAREIAELKEGDEVDIDVDEENGVLLATYRIGK